jgi:hypothetical protein
MRGTALFLAIAQFANPAPCLLKRARGFGMNFSALNVVASQETERLFIFYKRDFPTGENLGFMNPPQREWCLKSWRENVGNTRQPISFRVYDGQEIFKWIDRGCGAFSITTILL